MHAARFAGTTGVLVAGGRATRMGGVPKGTLRLGGETLAARSVRLFRALFDDVLVVANDAAPWLSLGVRVVADVVPGKGAPGGLHAALRSAASPWIFAAACDMPFLAADTIGFLAARRAADLDVVLVRWRGRLEPLHAFWSTGCLPVLERELSAGDPSLQGFARSVRARVVEEDEWRGLDPDGRAFENANTPEDAARLGLVADHQL